MNAMPLLAAGHACLALELATFLGKVRPASCAGMNRMASKGSCTPFRRQAPQCEMCTCSSGELLSASMHASGSGSPSRQRIADKRASE